MRKLGYVIAATALLARASAGAEEGGAHTTPATIESFVVTATTPLSGIGVDPDKVPASVQGLSANDLSRQGSASVLDGLGNRAASVSMNSTLGDPFQPDVLFRGFAASPVLGTPQGLSVFQNGVRVNEAFGDAVNWDLIPDVAISRVDLVAANPVYGLNALGGTAAVHMKNGFDDAGLAGEIAHGSFGHNSGAAELGLQDGVFAAYLGTHLVDVDGWRKSSPDRLRQLYATAGMHGERAQFDIDLTVAHNRLSGQGTTPRQTLRVKRSLAFTTPQRDVDGLTLLAINGALQFSDTLALQANAYRRDFRERVENGNTTDYVACAGISAQLCETDGETPLISTTGANVPDLSLGGAVPIGQNDRERIDSLGHGGALQLAVTAPLFGRDNSLVFGARADLARTRFLSTAEVGVIDAALRVLPSGYFVDTPENAGFNTTPVALQARNRAYGLYLTDTWDLAPALAITASANDNVVRIALRDGRGTNLDGTSRFHRFNAALGATYRATDDVTLYAGYAGNNRAPTASEIECSDPKRPCLLPSSLSADPPTLKQVLARTIEVGVRGKYTQEAFGKGHISWSLGAFHTALDDDIYAVSSSLGAGYFKNIDGTRRQGIEASLAYTGAQWTTYAVYSRIDATFTSALALPSPNNVHADEHGDIHVRRGDRLPGIPRQQLKLGTDMLVTPALRVGAQLSWYGSQYLRGDESNQNKPLPGYAVFDLHGTYALREHVAFFVDVRNVFGTRYVTFGQLGDPTGIGAPGVPADANTNDARVDNRFLSPAAPRTVVAGVRVHL